MGYELVLCVRYQKGEQTVDVQISELCDDLSDPQIEKSALGGEEERELVTEIRKQLEEFRLQSLL